jgi:hypothetical protein
MDSKYCSACARKLLLSSFLKDPSADPSSKVFATCIPCRNKSKKRRALQAFDQNRPSKKTDISRPLFEVPTEPSILPAQRRVQPRPIQSVQHQPTPPVQHHAPPQEPIPPAQPRVRRQPPLQPLRPQAPQPIQPAQRPVEHQTRVPQPIPAVQRPVRPQPPLPAQPQTAGFLPSEQWGYIQSFHAAMNQVEMETCGRCKERWFTMDLKAQVCHACFLRDKRNQSPFLMSADNNMDPGEVPAHLPELTQVEEMIIARSHVQMMVHRYRGHQYHYTGHCVSFMQNTVKTVDLLPNLPAELDIVVLRPSDRVVKDDPPVVDTVVSFDSRSIMCGTLPHFLVIPFYMAHPIILLSREHYTNCSHN